MGYALRLMAVAVQDIPYPGIKLRAALMLAGMWSRFTEGTSQFLSWSYGNSTWQDFQGYRALPVSHFVGGAILPMIRTPHQRTP